MTILRSMIDLILHIDKHLLWLVSTYGVWTYIVLFGIVFAETGLVVLPFLPGDSLLFAAGSLAAIGAFNIWVIWGMLIVAAFAGDTLNYWVGRLIGPQLFAQDRRFLKRAHYEKAHAFLEKHGGAAIVFARFVPIVRTFAPCVAGVGKMNYSHFMFYNLAGGVLWVSLFTLGGYFFGQIPIIKHNFHYMVIGIVVLSVVPLIWEYFQQRRHGHVSA